MSSKQANRDAVIRQGFLPIYVHDRFDSRTLIEGAIEAGCTVLEYTCRRHDAREMIPWIKKEFPHVAVFGATLVDGPRVEKHLKKTTPNFIPVAEMVDLGVDGLVSFVRFRPETYEHFGEHLVFIAGVSTANEALDQLELGADLVKMAVGTQSQIDVFRTSRAAVHHAYPVMVTSGVTVEKAAECIRDGAVLTSAGFDLTLKDMMDKPEQVTKQIVADRMKAYLDAVRVAREKSQPAFAKAVADGVENPLQAGPWVC